MYISYGSTDPSIVRYFSKRVPRSLSTTSGQFVIDSATVAAWSLVEGEVACAQGRVELVCDAEGVCSGKSPTNMANVDVAYGALKMTCTSKKVCEFTDAHVGKSTWGGHIDLECKGTQTCRNSKFTSSSGKIVAVCQGGPKTCLATTFSSGRTMDITCEREGSCTRTHFAGGGHVSLTCKKPDACLDITLADDGTTCEVESATTEITVSDPGKARIFVKNLPVTVNCYGADVITNSIFNCVG